MVRKAANELPEKKEAFMKCVVEKLDTELKEKNYVPAQLSDIDESIVEN